MVPCFIGDFSNSFQFQIRLYEFPNAYSLQTQISITVGLHVGINFEIDLDRFANVMLTFVSKNAALFAL